MESSLVAFILEQNNLVQAQDGLGCCCLEKAQGRSDIYRPMCIFLLLFGLETGDATTNKSLTKQHTTDNI